MFCEKCGGVLADGERFCPNCGAQVVLQPQEPAAEQLQQPYAEQPQYAEQPSYDAQPEYGAQPAYDAQPQVQPYAAEAPVSDGYVFNQTPEKPSKKANKKRIAIIAAAVVACVGIVFGILALTGVFSKKDDAMHAATKGAVRSIIEKTSSLMDSNALDDLGSFSLQIEPGSMLKTVGSSAGFDLSWLNDVKVNVVTENNDNKLTVGAAVVINDVEIGQLNAVVDTGKGTILLGIDGLSDSMLKIDSGMSGTSSLPLNISSGMSADQLKELMGDVDTDDLTDLLLDYIDAALDALDDVDESSGTITAGGVSGDCTVVTIKVSEKTLMKMAKAILDKAADDGDLKDLFKEIYPAVASSMGAGSMDFDTFYSYIQQYIKQYADSMDAAISSASGDTLCTIIEYIDGEDLVGLKVEAQGVDVFFGFAQDGDKFGVEVTAMGQTYVKGSGTKDGDKLTGDIQLLTDGSPILNVKLDGFDFDSGEGAVELSLPSAAADKLGLDPQIASVISTLSLRIEKSGSGATFDLNVMGQSALKATMTPGEKKSIAVNTGLPTTQNKEEWLASLDIDALKSRLTQAGMPEELLTTLLTGAGLQVNDPNDPFGGENNIRLMVWAADSDLTKEMCDKFIAQYPEKTISIDVQPMSEGDASAMVKNDPGAVDVFAFACDQLAGLNDAGLLSALDDDTAYDIYLRDISPAYDAAVIDEKVLAYPLTGANGYYLVYDKRYITDEDAQTLEGVLKACRKAGKKFIMDGGNGFYACLFAFTGGLELDGMADGVQQFNNYDEDEVLDALEAFNKLITEYSDVFQSDNVDKISAGMSGTKTTVAAGFDGSWNIAAAQKALGTNYGAAKLPTISIKGTDTQIISMNGYKLMGVNSRTQYPNAAHLLAEYLTNDECQRKRLDELGWIPSNWDLSLSYVAEANAGCGACLEQAEYSVPQVNVANTFWSPMGSLGSYLTKGAHTRAEIKTEFEKAIANIKDE